MLQAVIASLKKAGVTVPENCDETMAIALVNEALAAVTDTSGRDWRAVDAACACYREALAHADDFKPAVLDTRANDVVEATKAAAIGFVFFSDVRAARPSGQALLDFVEVVKEELRNVPVPGAIRVR